MMERRNADAAKVGRRRSGGGSSGGDGDGDGDG
jgi:hypothetical protein